MVSAFLPKSITALFSFAGFGALTIKLLSPENSISSRIDRKLNNEAFKAFIACSKFKDLVLHSTDTANLNFAETTIKTRIVEQCSQPVKGRLPERDIIKLKKLFRNLRKLHGDIVAEVSEQSVTVACDVTKMDVVEREMSNFRADYEVITWFVPLDFGQFDFLQNFRKTNLTQLYHEYKGIEVEPVDDPFRKGFLIHGQKSQCREFIYKLQFLCTRVAQMSLTVDCSNVLDFMDSARGRDVISEIQLQEDKHCVIKISGPKHKQKHNLLECKVADCTISKFVISLHVSCPTALKADVLVNPSSIDFEHHCGLSGTIVEKGKFF